MEAGGADASRFGHFGDPGTRSGFNDGPIDCRAKSKTRVPAETFAAKSKSSEPPKNDLAKNVAPDNHAPNSQPQWTAAVQLKPVMCANCTAITTSAS